MYCLSEVYEKNDLSDSLALGTRREIKAVDVTLWDSDKCLGFGVDLTSHSLSVRFTALWCFMAVQPYAMQYRTNCRDSTSCRDRLHFRSNSPLMQ